MSFGPQQPYATPSPGSFDPKPPKSGWSMGCILGILAVVLGGGGLLCCGGIFGGGYAATMFFIQVASQEIAKQPVVKEHLGEVTSCTVDFGATGQLGKEDHFVFNVKGTKGSGVVTAHVDSSNGVRILSGDLRLPAGESFPLEARP